VKRSKTEYIFMFCHCKHNACFVIVQEQEQINVNVFHGMILLLYTVP